VAMLSMLSIAVLTAVFRVLVLPTISLSDALSDHSDVSLRTQQTSQSNWKPRNVIAIDLLFYDQSIRASSQKTYLKNNIITLIIYTNTNLHIFCNSYSFSKVIFSGSLI